MRHQTKFTLQHGLLGDHNFQPSFSLTLFNVKIEAFSLTYLHDLGFSTSESSPEFCYCYYCLKQSTTTHTTMIGCVPQSVRRIDIVSLFQQLIYLKRKKLIIRHYLVFTYRNFLMCIPNLQIVFRGYICLSLLESLPKPIDHINQMKRIFVKTNIRSHKLL